MFAAMRAYAVLGNVALAVALGPCSKVDIGLDEPKAEPFEVTVHVVSDPGVPLPGAEVLSVNSLLGKTDADGAAGVRFTGKEGDQVELTVRCPADYESPAAPLVVGLRRLAAGSKAPQFDVRCPPEMRTFVVGVRAENGANLPVEYLGRVVAQTDSSGAAVFRVRVRPLEQVEIMLDTSQPGAEQLRPVSPHLTFVAKDYEDFVVLDQNFTIEKKPVHYGPKPARPKPL
jgi:hypothetical protein